MLKIVGIIAAVIVVIVAGILIRATFQPDTFQVARSVTINAPAEKIFPLINDLQNFKTWSPYENKDPQMKRTISAASAGKGATYAWDGNGEVGAGQMTIADSASPSKVTINLDMLKPMKASNVVNFSLAPQGNATTVTWAMKGDCPFIGKVMGVIFDMDKMVGGDFEKGLATLKQVSERG